jgi:hypothetical protein
MRVCWHPVGDTLLYRCAWSILASCRALFSSSIVRERKRQQSSGTFRASLLLLGLANYAPNALRLLTLLRMPPGDPIEHLVATLAPTLRIATSVFLETILRKSCINAIVTEHHSSLILLVGLDVCVGKLSGLLLIFAASALDPLAALEADGSGILILDVVPMLPVVAFYGLRHLAPTALF